MTPPEAVGLSSERLARVRPALEKHIGPHKIAGAVTLLARRGEVVHRECVGLLERESGAPMPPDALFRIYSMTKPITCVALMTLYEQGCFQLIDPREEFIGVQMAQFQPNGFYQIANDFRVAAYQAIVD
jgi:CubicO group peptidase (beta-lactamase class C family)